MRGNHLIQAQSLSCERSLISALWEQLANCVPAVLCHHLTRGKLLLLGAPLCTATTTNPMHTFGSTRQRCSTQQIYSEDTFSPCFQKLPKLHRVIFSILPNTDPKFADFHIPCSIKDVSQKRFASLVVELLSVIARLKYKSE